MPTAGPAVFSMLGGVFHTHRSTVAQGPANEYIRSIQYRLYIKLFGPRAETFSSSIIVLYIRGVPLLAIAKGIV